MSSTTQEFSHILAHDDEHSQPFFGIRFIEFRDFLFSGRKDANYNFPFLFSPLQVEIAHCVKCSFQTRPEATAVKLTITNFLVSCVPKV